MKHKSHGRHPPPGGRASGGFLWPLSGLGFLLLTLLCRAPSLRAPMTEDAATYLYVGRTIFHGGTPYVDAVETKGPATHLLYGAVDLVSGSSPTVVRLALALAAALTALLLARWVARSAGVRTGLIAGALFASLGTLTALEGVDPNTEQVGVLFMVGAVLLASSGTTLAAAGAGALSGWAILMNPGFATIVLLAGFELLRATRGSGHRASLRAAAAFGAGMIAIAAPFAVWLGAAGALDDMKTQVWDFSRLSAEARLTISPPATSLTDLHHLFDVPAGSLWIAGAAGALVAIAIPDALRRIGVSALLWIVLSWLRVKSNHGFEWGHHYYVGMPGIVAGMAAGVGAMLDTLPRRLGIPVAAVLLAVPLWTFVARPQLHELQLPRDQRAGAGRFGEAYPIAAAIRRETPPGSADLRRGQRSRDLLDHRPHGADTLVRRLRAVRLPPLLRRARASAAPRSAASLACSRRNPDRRHDSLQRLIRDLRYRLAWQSRWGTVWSPRLDCLRVSDASRQQRRHRLERALGIVISLVALAGVVFWALKQQAPTFPGDTGGWALIGAALPRLRGWRRSLAAGAGT